MIIRVLATTPDCRDGNCPGARLTDRGTVVVQGYTGTQDVTDAQVPVGEGVVEVPEEIILQAAAGILATRKEVTV